MWMFLSALVYAAPDAPPISPAPAAVPLPNAILVQDGNTLLIIQREETVLGESSWTLIHKIEDVYGYYYMYDVVDLDGDGIVEIVLTFEMEGNAILFPMLIILKIKNNKYEAIENVDMIIDGHLELIKTSKGYTFRLHTEIPGTYTDYVLSGTTLQELPRVSAKLPTVTPMTTPPWLRSEYGAYMGICRPMRFTIHETTIEYDYPNIGKATIANIAINADTLLITTNLPAPWTVIRLTNVPQSKEIIVAWSASHTGPFDNECTVEGGNIPGW